MAKRNKLVIPRRRQEKVTTSRRRERREKSCLGKKTFRSYTAAYATIAEHKARYILDQTNELHVYECPFGTHLHLGHSWPTTKIRELMRDFPLKMADAEAPT